MSADVGTALAQIVRHLRDSGIPYMVVGSVAGLVHGRVRSTIDVDVVIDPTVRSLSAFVASLPEEDFYVSSEAAAQALTQRSQFNVIDFASGLKIDLIVRKDRPFSASEFSRKVPVVAFDIEFPVATLEDTILAKLEWGKKGGSARQLEDVEELVRLAGDSLDEAYLDRWAADLDITEYWLRVRSSG